MKTITRIFKRKIRGEELEGLAKAFNVDLRNDFKAYDGWSAVDIYAKLNTIPQKDSLKLEAYFNSKEVHYPHLPNTDDAEFRKGTCFERTKEIPYTSIKDFNIKIQEEQN